jgi:hypothetical protein
MKLGLDKKDFKTLKFQMGGGVPPEGVPVEGVPEEGQEDPIQLLLQGAVQAIENKDCNTAMQVCQVLIQTLGGGEGEPPQEPVVQKKGGPLKVRYAGNKKGCKK